MKYCTRPFAHIHVFPDGECRLCGWMSGSIGNLIQEDLHNIWHSEKAEIIRDAMRHENFEYCHETSCPYLENNSLPDIDDEKVLHAEATELPISLNVACDFICNHSCPSCRQKVFVPDEQYCKNLTCMLDKLKPALQNAKVISTCGNGDALASPYIMNMLKELHPVDHSCEIGIETNGALFDEKHWEQIKHLGEYPFSVAVTPNSFERTTFKYLNGGHDSYDQVIHNLGFLRELRRKGKINNYQISIVVQDRNFNELPDFAERCINEFEVDQVVVKPLYHWFGMPREEYWFKDVLNPSHPYHKEYLEMMKDSRLQNPKVYFWGGKNLHTNRRHPAYQFEEHMALTAKLLEVSDAPKKLEAYLHSQGVHSLYIHGDQDLATVLYKILSQTDIEIRGFTAKYVHQSERCGQPVIPICDWVPDDVDAMLIIRYEFMYKIVNDFDYMGFKGKLIPVDELVEKVIG